MKKDELTLLFSKKVVENIIAEADIDYWNDTLCPNSAGGFTIALTRENELVKHCYYNGYNNDIPRRQVIVTYGDIVRGISLLIKGDDFRADIKANLLQLLVDTEKWKEFLLSPELGDCVIQCSLFGQTIYEKHANVATIPPEELETTTTLTNSVPAESISRSTADPLAIMQAQLDDLAERYDLLKCEHKELQIKIAQLVDFIAKLNLQDGVLPQNGIRSSNVVHAENEGDVVDDWCDICPEKCKRSEIVSVDEGAAWMCPSCYKKHQEVLDRW